MGGARGAAPEGRAGGAVGLGMGSRPLYWGADEYEAVVDAERGVLLRCASRLGGGDFDALEVEEIHFDEDFPEGTFTSREPLPWS